MYISPLVATLCILVLSGLVALSLMPHPWSTLLSLRPHTVTNSIRGEWVRYARNR